MGDAESRAARYVLRGDVLEPEGIATFRKVPAGFADEHHDPAPMHVVTLLRGRHRCEPYPAKPHQRHHIGVWELYITRLPLTPQSKSVALILVQHWPNVRPSYKRIADLTGLSRGSVDNAVRILKHCGLLTVDGTRGRTSNTYHPHYPVRDVGEAEVAEFGQWIRLPVKPRPNDPPGGQSTVHVVDPTVHHVDRYPPPGGHEVSNEANREVRDEVLASFADRPGGLMREMRRKRLDGLGATS